MVDRTVGRALTHADWARLSRRDAGPWFYAVVTTGIICRGGCPARTPLRTNVRVVDSLDQAVAAGFRTCRRCRPGG